MHLFYAINVPHLAGFAELMALCFEGRTVGQNNHFSAVSPPTKLIKTRPLSNLIA